MVQCAYCRNRRQDDGSKCRSCGATQVRGASGSGGLDLGVGRQYWALQQAAASQHHMNQQMAQMAQIQQGMIPYCYGGNYGGNGLDGLLDGFNGGMR